LIRELVVKLALVGFREPAVLQAFVCASEKTGLATNEEAVALKFAVPYIIYFVIG
jgi:hypothetical protein